ncbi:DUF6338 family protein [Halobaculum sp. MBLA0147]|uniref:DUF6338 family protein n=1 Tax=Halobaculum sp. MBLA0147 TaxID=3079934 RepID=UPI0035232C6D
MTPDVGLQTSVSFGRQLLFFLFLLIPGYLTVRTYYWANVAIEDRGRVNRLVLMAIGGFVSLAIVALWRELVPTFRVGFLEWLSPSWLVVEERLSVGSISRLSILESTHLILWESLVGVLLGYVYGTAKYVTYDQRRQERTQLKQPWEKFVESVGTGANQTVEVITSDGERVVGEVVGLGSPSEAYDLLLTEPRTPDGTDDESNTDGGGRGPDGESGSRGDLSYHHYEDISHVYLRDDALTNQTTRLQDRHTDLLQYLRNLQGGDEDEPPEANEDEAGSTRSLEASDDARDRGDTTRNATDETE